MLADVGGRALQKIKWDLEKQSPHPLQLALFGGKGRGLFLFLSAGREEPTLTGEEG